jgi:hypothetical protein
MHPREERQVEQDHVRSPSRRATIRAARAAAITAAPNATPLVMDATTTTPVSKAGRGSSLIMVRCPWTFRIHMAT